MPDRQSKEQSKKWIVNVYLNLKFQNERDVKVLVDLNQYSINNSYNEELAEFLKPDIKQVDLSRSKYSKKLKTYA